MRLRLIIGLIEIGPEPEDFYAAEMRQKMIRAHDELVAYLNAPESNPPPKIEAVDPVERTTHDPALTRDDAEAAVRKVLAFQPTEGGQL